MSQPPQQPPPGEGQYGWGQPYGYYHRPPDHPDAVAVLVLGILSIVVCGLCGPFAWAKGNTALAEIRAAQGRWGGESMVTAGRICGIVGTALLIVSLAFVVLWLLFVGGLFLTAPDP